MNLFHKSNFRSKSKQHHHHIKRKDFSVLSCISRANQQTMATMECPKNHMIGTSECEQMDNAWMDELLVDAVMSGHVDDIPSLEDTSAPHSHLANTNSDANLAPGTWVATSPNPTPISVSGSVGGDETDSDWQDEDFDFDVHVDPQSSPRGSGCMAPPMHMVSPETLTLSALPAAMSLAPASQQTIILMNQLALPLPLKSQSSKNTSSKNSGPTKTSAASSSSNISSTSTRSCNLSLGQSSVPILGRHMALGYFDYADVPDELQEIPPEERNTGGVQRPFPERLHDMLAQSDNQGSTFSDVVSWSPHGRCFVVRKPKQFQATILPLYFNQTKYRSFQRQLNLYGFRRITGGVDRGGYYHPLLLRARRKLCTRIRRTKSANKGGAAGAAASAAASSVGINVNTNALIDSDMEPNFYSMPPVGDVPNPEFAAVAMHMQMQCAPQPPQSSVVEVQNQTPPAPATFSFNLKEASPLTAALFSR
jgi:hypothetical protein